MQLNHEPPDYAYSLRAADGRSARVNDQSLSSSFFLTPEELATDWPVLRAADLQVADLEPILALGPALIVLGTGDRQVFPPAVVMAACLSRGIGLEVMNNPAAARTFNILAGEGRKVAAAFILEG
ncbi:Mth938-like domain-containing protein [Stenotrophomonas sp. S48]|uniref:Mth938-like domain-containing protein n=1 Tax=unclassified Stenotrophomonas TaxID=196198 RepID=UPI0019024BEB|nr:MULTISPECIES: Mth938-like domain-containing protein [unclassified Stenotrophomonas]MBK0027379.1 Mth938-like domain-containing protein [Stenotrophomonas sp. S48]MBK0048216.1 Mth938-like domain-containing protein [Stenotrophomonas sp. S49]